ncbi:MAG: hypothetical protein ACD_8C00006G0007 [uncultured bacterium]|nr:MAG: hypothetical protein ACD_8C00006G0007 [uncultured bacterium]
MRSKKNVHVLMSAVGWVTSFVSALLEALLEKGISAEKIHEFVTSSGKVSIAKIVDALAGDINGVVDVPVETVGAENAYAVSVDYNMSVEEAVKLGSYDWSNSDVTTKNFPTKLSGKTDVEIKLFHFDRNISSENAIMEMDKTGYRPAETHELLALGAKYPDLQREFSIIALGSVWRHLDGSRYVAYLRRRDSRRKLHLRNFGIDWLGRCRFAAVRK